DDDEHLFEALRQGADGYLLKDETDERMVHLLRQFAEGQPPLSASIARRILGSFHAPAGSEGLTPREQDVLVLAAKGYSARQISDMLGLSPHTTAGYLKGVYRKLQVNSRAEATLAAIRLGLVAPGNA
ncbi:MAG: response regulator transcription factor, partial [Gammaproteobacteria bacterium]|nr:response regulator transcription factor [Gammaproteobacteria bacterium]